jgi:hypothetical protein
LDRLVIVVTLGSDSNFLQGSLSLNELVLIGEQTTCITDPAPIVIDLSVTTPRPILLSVLDTTPLFSISCGENPLLIRGDKSLSVKRFNIHYSWTASGTASTSDLVAYLAAQGDVNLHYIDPDLLKAGILTLTLTVNNDLGDTSTVTKNIIIRGTRYLSVVLAPGFTYTYSTDKSLTVSSSVSDRCDTFGTLSYTWSFVSSTKPNYDGSSLVSSVSQSSLSIPSNTLEAPYNYIFSVNVTESTGVWGTAQIELTVVYPPLVAVLNKVSGVISSNQDLTISAASSYDPSGNPLTYLWSCTTAINTPCASASGTVLDLGTSSSVTITNDDLADYVNYYIKVTISTSVIGDARTASSEIELYSINSNPTAIWIEPPVRPSHQYPLFIFPLIIASPSSTFTWVQKNGPTVDINSDPSVPSLTVLPESPNPLQEGVEYHFELSIYDSDNNLESAATLLFTTNEGPIGGTFAVNPMTGTEFDTRFTMSAFGFSDGDNLDLPLKYQYYFKVPNSNTAFKFIADSSKDSYTTILSRFVNKAVISVCDTVPTCTTQEIQFTVNRRGLRMLNSELLDLYNTILSEPDNIPAATILIGTLEELDKETYNIIKTRFDEYSATLPQDKSNRELILSVYQALASAQKDILDNSEILGLLEICNSILKDRTDVTEKEVSQIYETFYPIIASRSEDSTLVAKSMKLFNEISWATLNGDSPAKLNKEAISGNFYSKRLFAKDLEGLSIELEGFSFTLPKTFENKYTIYDIYTQVLPTQGLPIISTFLSEVGNYQQFQLSFSDKKPVFSSATELFTIEVPNTYKSSKLDMKCQIFSYDTETWDDSECNSEVVDSKIKITTLKIGAYRFDATELANSDNPDSILGSECEMNPAPYAIVCVWFGIVIMMFMMTIMTRMNKPHLYRPVNLTIDTHKTDRVTVFDGDMSPKGISLPPVVIQPPTPQVSRVPLIFKQHILYDLFSNQAPLDTINHIGSFMSSMFFGFALLGAFVYGFGDMDDNTNYSLEDVSDEYYPGDMKYVFIALALVIPVALPLRVLVKTKLNAKIRIPAAIFSMVVLIASIVGVLLMGGYFCQGASVRWTLAYLIYIPLEVAISEFLVAAVLFMVRTR